MAENKSDSREEPILRQVDYPRLFPPHMQQPRSTSSSPSPSSPCCKRVNHAEAVCRLGLSALRRRAVVLFPDPKQAAIASSMEQDAGRSKGLEANRAGERLEDYVDRIGGGLGREKEKGILGVDAHFAANLWRDTLLCGTFCLWLVAWWAFIHFGGAFPAPLIVCCC